MSHPSVPGVGQYPIGHWHAREDAPALDWDRLVAGEELPTLAWRLEAFENTLLSFFSEVRDDRYLVARSGPLVGIPVAALWASFSHLSSRYRTGPIIDVEHDFSFRRPLEVGAETELSGCITDKWERKGRFYLSWSTHCRDSSDQPIFDFHHTIIDLRELS